MGNPVRSSCLFPQDRVKLPSPKVPSNSSSTKVGLVAVVIIFSAAWAFIQLFTGSEKRKRPAQKEISLFTSSSDEKGRCQGSCSLHSVGPKGKAYSPFSPQVLAVSALFEQRIVLGNSTVQQKAQSARAAIVRLFCLMKKIEEGQALKPALTAYLKKLKSKEPWVWTQASEREPRRLINEESPSLLSLFSDRKHYGERYRALMVKLTELSEAPYLMTIEQLDELVRASGLPPQHLTEAEKNEQKSFKGDPDDPAQILFPKEKWYPQLLVRLQDSGLVARYEHE